jgi:Xaa-Pro aminopeptidase
MNDRTTHENRVREVQRALAQVGGDLLVLFPSANMLYLSGFYDEPGERLLFLLVPREGSPVFLVPELYARQVREESAVADLRVWKDSDDPLDSLRRTVGELAAKAGKVLVDDGMGAVFFLMLKQVLPGAELSLASRIMKPLRMRKTPEEVRCLQEAGIVADQAFSEIMGWKIEGKTELAVAAALEEAMKNRGADKIAFETLVASGPNGALPHHRAGRRVISPGDVIILDYGCRIGGYCSDISRTVVCKKATPEIRAVYEIVARAQEKAVQAVAPGVPARTVDLAARQEIAGAGYGERFIHRTGHGIGLEVHEEPYITEANPLELQTGMAFSIEPGIYLQGQFGIRIEDIVVVTAGGAQRLNNVARALQVLR